MPKKINRCSWSEGVNLDYIEYHDREWGVPVTDDRTQFEFLILEGAQAGLSWSTILNKREGYRKNFADFDPQKPGLQLAPAFDLDGRGRRADGRSDGRLRIDMGAYEFQSSPFARQTDADPDTDPDPGEGTELLAQEQR